MHFAGNHICTKNRKFGLVMLKFHVFSNHVSITSYVKVMAPQFSSHQNKDIIHHFCDMVWPQR